MAKRKAKKTTRRTVSKRTVGKVIKRTRRRKKGTGGVSVPLDNIKTLIN